ncbi:MAG: J domain-containing protein [Anaerolineae bacterium]
MRQSPEYCKRKLRQLKKLEVKLRFGDRPLPVGRTLIWDEFFSTKDADDPAVRYTLHQMTQMDRQARKEVFAEYFYRVYFQRYKENGILPTDVYDPMLLSFLGLPHHADRQAIKRRFRELAKRYHPDHGGDAAQFIAMMDVYEKLLGEA